MTNKFCKYSTTGNELFKRQSRVYTLKDSPFLSDNGLDYYKSSNRLCITGAIGSAKTLLLVYLIADMLVDSYEKKVIYLDTELTFDFCLLKQLVSDKISIKHVDVDNFLLLRLIYLPIRNPIELSVVLDGLEIYLKLNNTLVHSLVFDSITFWSHKWMSQYASGNENQLKNLITASLNKARSLCAKYSLFFVYTKTTRNVGKGNSFVVRLNTHMGNSKDTVRSIPCSKLQEINDIKLITDQGYDSSYESLNRGITPIMGSLNFCENNNDLIAPINGRDNLHNIMEENYRVNTPKNTKMLFGHSFRVSNVPDGSPFGGDRKGIGHKSYRPVRLLCNIPEYWINKEKHRLNRNEFILMLSSVRDDDIHYIVCLSNDNRRRDEISRSAAYESSTNSAGKNNELVMKYESYFEYDVKRIRFDLETDEIESIISNNKSKTNDIATETPQTPREQMLDSIITKELLEKYNFAVYSFDELYNYQKHRYTLISS